MINNIPKEWEIKELGNLVNFIIGKTPSRNKSEYFGGNNPWVSIADMKSKFLSHTKECITNEAIKDSGIKKVKKGTLLLSYKLSIGKLSFALNDLYTNEAIASLEILSDKLIKEFLYYVLKHTDLERTTDRAVMGKTLNKSKLQVIPIPIPPLQQQEKIVKVLDLSSNLIEKQKEFLKKYDLFLKSKFIEMFGDPITNPMGWETKKLGILADWKGGGTPSRKEPQYFNGSIPWITTVSLGKLYISEKDAVEFITNEAVMKSSAKIIPINSIIIGTRVGVGKVSINKIELCTNQDIMSMTNISTDLSNIFLYFFINYYNEFLKSQQRGATIQGITAPVLKDLNTILPPIEIQNKFASIVEKIEIIKEKENQKLKQLEDLHNSLMQKAFKGEIE